MALYQGIQPLQIVAADPKRQTQLLQTATAARLFDRIDIDDFMVITGVCHSTSSAVSS
jgi:hypothetical protein